MDEDLIKVLADPHGLSGDSYPDGTPMTNLEKYRESQRRSGQF